MVFSSHLFLFYFLPLALGLYYLVPRRLKQVMLTVLSYIFYGWANPYFVVLMFTSTVIDYFCGLSIAGRLGSRWSEPIVALPRETPRTRLQKNALIVSICTNIGLLAFFKYFNFGIDNYNAAMAAMGLGDLQWETFFRVTLPLGISFYTFQSMSYTIDVYKGEVKAVRNFTDFSCYVSMFPQLVAGPIVRFREVAGQLRERRHTLEKFARGVSFISLGIAKKILIANPCGKIADTCFGAGALAPVDAWYGMFAYSFQIYFDFSGYSDMAIGLGLMLGFVFPKNFDSPYRSESITEMWRRWHISLSTWLRDYLYVPLGGNRRGTVRTYINVGATMLLGGLWHGAAWNFIIWGGIHGGMLAFERAQGKDSIYRRAPRVIRVALTFLITCFAWVFFRAPDLESALRYLQHMFGFGPSQDGMHLASGLIYQPYYLIMMIVAVVVIWGFPQTWDFTRRLTSVKALWCVMALLMAIAVLSTQAFNPFIYFIF